MVREGGRGRGDEETRRGGWIATGWEGDKSNSAAVTRLMIDLDSASRLALMSSPDNNFSSFLPLVRKLFFFMSGAIVLTE